MNSSVSLLEGLQRKLFHVCLGNNVIHNGIYRWTLVLGRLQLVHESHGKVATLIVKCVQVLAQDLLDYLIVAYAPQLVLPSHVECDLHQYETIGRNFSNWAARFAKGVILGILSFAGNAAAMVDMFDVREMEIAKQHVKA